MKHVYVKLSRYLTDIGTSKSISHGIQDIPPFNHILFADDMSLLAQDRGNMQCLMDVIQEFEVWRGIPVNTTKTKLMIIDGIKSNRNVPVRVENDNIPLDVTPETETVCYLGFWVTPNGNMRVTMDLVVERTLRGKETIQGHPLGPRQEVEVIATKAVGNFLGR